MVIFFLWNLVSNFTLFSREKGWNFLPFHSFREMKVKNLKSRSESEIKMTRDREVKFQKNLENRDSRRSLYQGFGFWTSSPPAGVDVDYFNNKIPLKDVAATSPNPFLTPTDDSNSATVWDFVRFLVLIVLIDTTGTSEAETSWGLTFVVGMATFLGGLAHFGESRTKRESPEL